MGYTSHSNQQLLPEKLALYLTAWLYGPMLAGAQVEKLCTCKASLLEDCWLASAHASSISTVRSGSDTCMWKEIAHNKMEE